MNKLPDIIDFMVFMLLYKHINRIDGNICYFKLCLGI